MPPYKLWWLNNNVFLSSVFWFEAYWDLIDVFHIVDMTDKQKSQVSSPVGVLMEMRPALDGYYGIPQETRLLFAALAGSPQVSLQGLLQMSKQMTRGGVALDSQSAEADKVHRYARTVVSLKGDAATDWKMSAAQWVAEKFHALDLYIRALGDRALPSKVFATRYFRDFVWQQLFARSVPPQLRENVLTCNYSICASPWRWVHQVGITYAQLTGRPRYPRIDTRGHDVFIAQTPYPGRVSPGTAMVVHYHDAIPVLMPHTISDRAFHQASHFYALKANVRDGAWFACVSEATRCDLLTLFPEAETRAVTIHNMVPDHYHPHNPEPQRLAGIVRRHVHGPFRPSGAKGSDRIYELARRFGNEDEKTAFYQRAFAPGSRYLLMVSTLEPRKNHARLLEAWEALRDRVDPDLKLVFVGHIGWDYRTILDACVPWVEQGGLFMLHSVPADALRVLYQQALVTVCPSVGEGFDFSGVEAMRCGGVVAASDIPVHREVYGEAAAYFDPYDTASTMDCLRSLIDGDEAFRRREALRTAGEKQSEQYLSERIVPKWVEFLQKVAASRYSHARIK